MISLSNHSKEKSMRTPIENHQTAAWANIEETKPVSNVPIPNQTEVINAKEYVDGNKK
jgi:hypothetical protein